MMTAQSDTQPKARTQRGGHSVTYEVFILALTIFSLFVILLLLLWPLTDSTRQLLLRIDILISIVFMGDFLSRLYYAESKRTYLKWGWLDFLGSIPIVSILRFARLFRLARIIRFLRIHDRHALAQEWRDNRARTALQGTGFVVIVMMTLASVAVLQAESKSSEANIVTGDDAFWWSFVTITTVGYGDRYPVTPLGRFFAILLMSVGVGLFGVLTGYLSTSFLKPAEGEDVKDLDSGDRGQIDLNGMRVEMTNLHQELAGVRRDLAELKNMLSAHDG